MMFTYGCFNGRYNVVTALGKGDHRFIKSKLINFV